MITVFNRRLVLETYDITKAEALAQRLKNGGVPYKLITRVPASSSPFTTLGETVPLSSQQPPTNGRTLYRVYIRAGQEGV